MKASDLIMLTTRLVVANGNKGELSARELRDFLNDLGAVVMNEMKNAPCDHDGTKWFNRGKNYCGLCSREIPDGETV